MSYENSSKSALLFSNSHFDISINFYDAEGNGIQKFKERGKDIFNFQSILISTSLGEVPNVVLSCILNDIIVANSIRMVDVVLETTGQYKGTDGEFSHQFPLVVERMDFEPGWKCTMICKIGFDKSLRNVCRDSAIPYNDVKDIVKKISNDVYQKLPDGWEEYLNFGTSQFVLGMLNNKPSIDLFLNALKTSGYPIFIDIEDVKIGSNLSFLQSIDISSSIEIAIGEKKSNEKENSDSENFLVIPNAGITIENRVPEAIVDSVDFSRYLIKGYTDDFFSSFSDSQKTLIATELNAGAQGRFFSFFKASSSLGRVFIRFATTNTSLFELGDACCVKSGYTDDCYSLGVVVGKTYFFDNDIKCVYEISMNPISHLKESEVLAEAQKAKHILNKTKTNDRTNWYVPTANR